MEVRPAGFVIQPNLFWLVAAPSGLISDKNIPEQFGIVLVKSPRAKPNFDPFVLLQDSSFCVEKLETDLLCLKQKHSDAYYEAIQVCMGSSVVSYADFVYYTFIGLVIVRVKFDKEHFQKLIVKLNSFYKDYVVPQVLKKKKREIILFTKNCFMFSNEKIIKYNILYIIYYTKDHKFSLSHNRLIFS